MKKRIYQLDFLKFILAILILFHHYQGIITYDNPLIKFRGGFIVFGYIVELFFMLSGFFMGGDRLKKTESFSIFIKKRYLRLAPMAAISVIAYMIFHWIVIYPNEKFTILAILLNCTLLSSGGAFNGIVIPNNPLWYLCVLLICYVWYWVILWLCKKIKINPIYCFISMIFLGIGIKQYDINLPFLNGQAARGYMGFFTGIILCSIYLKIKTEKSRRITLILSFAAIILFVLSAIYDTDLAEDYHYLFYFCVFPAIILICLCSRLIDKIFTHSFWGELGGISFEIYLWHYPLINVFKTLIDDGFIKNAGGDTVMLIFGIIVIIWSTIMYYLVEKNLNKILK